MPLHLAPSKSSSQPLRPVDGFLRDWQWCLESAGSLNCEGSMDARPGAEKPRLRSHPRAHQWRGQILLRRERSTPADRCHLGTSPSGSLSTGRDSSLRPQGLLPTKCTGPAMRRQLIRLLFAGLVTRIDHSYRNYSRARRLIGVRRFSSLPGRFGRSCSPIRATPRHPLAVATQTSGCSATTI
jgi:hypothetical protein